MCPKRIVAECGWWLLLSKAFWGVTFEPWSDHLFSGFQVGLSSGALFSQFMFRSLNSCFVISIWVSLSQSMFPIFVGSCFWIDPFHAVLQHAKDDSSKTKRWSTRGGLLRNIVGRSACSRTITWTSSPGMIRYWSCWLFSLGEREMGGKGKSMMCEHVCFSCFAFLINLRNSISIVYFFPFGVLFCCVVTQKFSDKIRHSYWLMWLCTWDMSLTCSLYIWSFEKKV